MRPDSGACRATMSCSWLVVALLWPAFIFLCLPDKLMRLEIGSLGCEGLFWICYFKLWTRVTGLRPCEWCCLLPDLNAHGGVGFE